MFGEGDFGEGSCLVFVGKVLTAFGKVSVAIQSMKVYVSRTHNGGNRLIEVEDSTEGQLHL